MQYYGTALLQLEQEQKKSHEMFDSQAKIKIMVNSILHT